MPVSTFFAITRAAGTAAPEGSFTCPTIVLVIVWPQPATLTITPNSASPDTTRAHHFTLKVICVRLLKLLWRYNLKPKACLENRLKTPAKYYHLVVSLSMLVSEMSQQ